MKQLNVVIMGNRQLAIDLVQFARAKHYNLFVIANPNDQASASEGLPSLARFMNETGLPFVQPPTLKDGPELQRLVDFEPDVIVSCSYERIIPQALIELPRISCINFHYALLPKNRGCMPVVWGILQQANTGVTLHAVDVGLDTGNIIFQEPVPITEGVTAKSHYLDCCAVAMQLAQQYFEQVERDTFPPERVQEHSRATYHKLFFPYDRWVQWDQPADQVANLINALTHVPHPHARTHLEGAEIGIIGPARAHRRAAAKPGTVRVDNGVCHIACRTGSVSIAQVWMNSAFKHPADILAAETLLTSPPMELEPQ